MSIVAYIAVMAITTYLIRVIPFVAVRGKIKSRFINSVLYYIPYAVLSAMTFPAIFFATGDVISSSVGTVVALVMAFFDLPLIVVALSSSAAALITSLIMSAIH
ncbi:AzlD domain-containing protein [uncultured Ruminococcus sp.]|uniref:AzlD domain-containing protein n=1 Tax=uncultured Ruminococcus sp. TaxID=165186 RepID=UPI00292DF351|nr:AzlD domain-containing protein [uncultured Ruminococcus sp.]